MRKTLNFGDLPSEFSSLSDSKIIILPVPFDQTSTWIKGADKGPQALIEASANMELYDIETDSEVYKQGIFTETPLENIPSAEKMVKAVKRKIVEHLQKEKMVITIGGEHSVSIGAIEAYAEKFDRLCVLQLDAHADLRNEYEGSKYNHACVMARVKEICPAIQVGIRSMDSSEKQLLSKENTFLAQDIRQNKNWIDQVLSKLSEQVYLTIDLDVFDPSIVPSTGTPEPGGLFWYEVLELTKRVVQHKNLVGFDLVELCPNPADKSSDYTAAKLIYQILSYKFYRN